MADVVEQSPKMPQDDEVVAKKSLDLSEDIDPDEGFVEARSVRQQWIEYSLLCLCNICWTVDAAILPIFFDELQKLFHVSQTQLSLLSTCKGWTAAIFTFPCGFLGEMLPRPQLIGFGMVSWSLGLLLVSVAWSFEVVFLGRVLNGVGLGIVQPLLLSLVADKSAPSKRGTAFGNLFFVGAVANTIFGLVATTYAATEIGGVPGWRLSVAVVAFLSASIGVAITSVVIEPNAPYLAERRQELGVCSVFTKNMPKVIQLFQYPTFVLILAQGGPGTAPWTVFPFFTQWLELSCFTHAQAGWIFSAFGWGGAFSNLLSGGLLNFVARRYPDHGPPTMANFSVFSGIPFLMLFFFVFPSPTLGHGWEVFPLYFVAFLAFGLGASMCGTINKKVFADIVPAQIFTYVFAIDSLIENTVGNFAGLAVGVLTDKVFHFDSTAAAEQECSPENADKLGMGMFTVCCVAWTLCFSVYLGMHWTYPKDRRRQLVLRREALKGKAAESFESKSSLESESSEEGGAGPAQAAVVIV